MKRIVGMVLVLLAPLCVAGDGVLSLASSPAVWIHANPLPLVEAVDLGKVNFGTNETTTVRVVNCLRTNIFTFTPEVTMVHAVYPRCTCPECAGLVQVERTTVELLKKIIYEEREFIVRQQTIRCDDRRFLPQVSTNRVYLP